MTNLAPTRRPLFWSTIFTAIAATLPGLATSQVLAQARSDTEGDRRSLPIKNNTFAARDSEKSPIRDWHFEQWVEEASVSRPAQGDGAILTGNQDIARGDLVSTPIEIEPFRFVEVTVEYSLELGDVGLFVTLRPKGQRELADLDFLPEAPPGERSQATVRLHTGRTAGPYQLTVSIVGAGTARVFSIEGYEVGPYARPERPVFVLDIMRDHPSKDGKLHWDSIEKLVPVFGFPSLEFLHFTEVTREKLEAIDPALIILSPKSEGFQNPDMGRLLEAVRTTVKAKVPVVGICLGHQMLTQLYPGASGDRGREWGPTRIQIVKDDPIFEGLPRHPYFYASESHNGMIRDGFRGVDIIASTDVCKTQIFRYKYRPRYTFQGHIERGWEGSFPEAYLIWKNMLRSWGLIP